MNCKQTVEKIRKFNRFYADVLGKIDQEIYNQSFSLTEVRVIMEIHLSNGCTATEVRKKLGIDRGYMSRIVQRLESEHVIIKKQVSNDKRQYLLYLSNDGINILNRLIDDANREVGRRIQRLSAHDASKLVTSMETIEAIYMKSALTPPDVLIRTFVPGDVGYIAYLHGRLYENTYQFGKKFEYYVMKGLTEFLFDSEGGELWVAEINGEIVGSIAITKNNRTVAQLRWFLIDERYQGMGIGKKLMEAAIQFCVEQKYQHIFLWTVSILTAARHLYKKYHFVLTEEKTNSEWTESMIVEERWDLDLSTVRSDEH
ncbi:hypothetical protein NG54_17155 [Heyndrickxia ginsengihumi]|uniref:Uncharacterized protein n=1 Tax=Heyndrickxia ginsengihumi TaxID=363870 RepID=A0A0A6V9C9_9BACI|nr:helix-turn-helix domain-containing GNAT family N-acetyltransferase [Heyndrickxia ginsengihumi]KHD84186.1 hypothetical protein NG54_17155 [Heyndrickxia ginsengihumi]